jgi:hypothetical protein
LVTTPHLHIEAASGIHAALLGAHFPTGVVAIPDLARMLIRDLGVAPRRADWQEVLDQAQASLDS